MPNSEPKKVGNVRRYAHRKLFADGPSMVTVVTGGVVVVM